MTDKHIIIDGVDVSGCIFYQSNFEEDFDVKIKHFCSIWHNSCESINNCNCNYKGWQRKEQECKDLKDENKKLKKEKRATIKYYDQQLGAVIKRYNDLLQKTKM